MDKEIFQFIIGGIVIVPVLFLIIRVQKKHHSKSYEPPRIDDSDPTDPRSLAGIRHRVSPPPG
jgi:hypothetical protein